MCLFLMWSEGISSTSTVCYASRRVVATRTPVTSRLQNYALHRPTTGIDPRMTSSPFINSLITFSSSSYLHTVLCINPAYLAGYVTPAIETFSLNYKNQSLLELLWHRKFKVVLFYVLQDYLIKPELSETNLYTRGSFVKWKLDSCISS